MSLPIFMNGIDAGTGMPLDSHLGITSEMLARVARGQRLTFSPEEQRDLRIRFSQDQMDKDHLGVKEGIDNTNLAESGWSVIFPGSMLPTDVEALKEALQPLLDLRRQQAGKYYREAILQKDESPTSFLKRFGKGLGPADPEKYPYYVLIAGSPEDIPFTFQYQLDVQYAVGRIYFDRLEQYHQYARSVVASETCPPTRARKAVFFGVVNDGDPATNLSASQLVLPLADQVKRAYQDWDVGLYSHAQATKAQLSQVLGGAKTPALLFTASHGMCFQPDDPRLLRHTGALVCERWANDPNAPLPITEDMYFSADDVDPAADVTGLVAFFFACYGGGMPKDDNFYRLAFGTPRQIAPYAFLSQLPLRLLAHPRGSALGVFAHVERAWGSSIQWEGTDDITTFSSTVSALLDGKPAGAAIEFFNSRYAQIATMLTEQIDLTSEEHQDDHLLAHLWTANHDARNYVFLGDPAVRLNTPAPASPA